MTCTNTLHDRPMVGLEAWRPWSCDPAAGDTCGQDLQAGEQSARLPSAHASSASACAQTCARARRRHAGQAAQALEAQAAAAQEARIAGLLQRQQELQAIVERLEAQATSESDVAAQRVQHLERLRAAEAEAAQRACAQV